MHLLLIVLIILLWCAIAIVFARYLDPSFVKTHFTTAVGCPKRNGPDIEVWTSELLQQESTIRNEVRDHYDKRCKCVQKISPVVAITSHYRKTWSAIHDVRKAHLTMPRTPVYFLYIGVQQTMHYNFATPSYLLCIIGNSIEIDEEDTISSGQWIATRNSTFTLRNMTSRKESGLFLAF